ncbi:hypothetical protein AWENTII_002955 [Aspergillus wentii]
MFSPEFSDCGIHDALAKIRGLKPSKRNPIVITYTLANGFHPQYQSWRFPRAVQTFQAIPVPAVAKTRQASAVPRDSLPLSAMFFAIDVLGVGWPADPALEMQKSS